MSKHPPTQTPNPTDGPDPPQPSRPTQHTVVRGAELRPEEPRRFLGVLERLRLRARRLPRLQAGLLSVVVDGVGKWVCVGIRGRTTTAKMGA